MVCERQTCKRGSAMNKIICDGKINPNDGKCMRCHEPAMNTSNVCGRLLDLETYDYHREEIEYWLAQTDQRKVSEFCLQHRVEVLFQADCQFHCFIDYKEGNGSYGIGLTAFGALYQGIHEYNRQKNKP